MSAGTHTFVFADLAGYTALTEAHGDEEAAEAAADFCEAVRAMLGEHGAEEVKAIGDALLIRATDAAQAAGLAERIVCEYGARHRILGVRVGLHTGTAVQRGGDWFGAAVNLAARVADVAQAGEVLCTEATRTALGEAAPVRPRGHHAFKNVVQPVPLYELVLRDRGEPLPTDPVCRMAVDPAKAPATRAYEDETYLFCSLGCAESFDRDPAPYLRRARA